jgi:hypothetical protein
VARRGTVDDGKVAAEGARAEPEHARRVGQTDLDPVVRGLAIPQLLKRRRDV